MTSTEVIDLLSSDDDNSVHIVDVKPAAKKRTSLSQEAWESTETTPSIKRQKQDFLPAEETKLLEQLAQSVQETFVVLIAGNDNAIVTPGDCQPLHVHSTTASITQHILQRDRWSCGYRNLQMLLSAFLPYAPLSHTIYQYLFRRDQQVNLPSVSFIQKSLEHAWEAGFDPAGARHFGHRLLGKQTWIGAVEVSSVLSFWGVDSAVVQFVKCPESRSLLAPFVEAYFDMTLPICPFCNPGAMGTTADARTLLDYRKIQSAGARVKTCMCPLLPMYLQWEGHSVTIVGMDKSRGQLLLHDPQRRSHQPARMSTQKLLMKDTQILMVTNFRSLSVAEKEQRKRELVVVTASEAAVASAIANTSR
eukprot:Nitzschia sp. Nitz4//scaffold102_size76354//55916//57001//NITZ4_005639-RA/size76354-processed-gene-0.26-mRNA-1//1//CDS//3329532270//383//frame0